MKRIFIRNLSNLGFGLAILILFIVSAFATINLRAFIDSNNTVNHTLLVLDKLGEALALLLDAETSQRAYIITGEENFLARYTTTLASNNGVSRHLQELRQLTSDNPNQQTRLNALDILVADKLAFMQETIDLRKNVGFESAQKAVLTDKGIQTMDGIRKVIAEMKNEEIELLQARTNTASARLQNTIVVIVIGALLGLSFLSLSFYLVNHEVRERRQAEETLRQVNKELDKRVEQLAAAKGQIEQQLHRLESLRAIDMAILGATDLRLALKTVLEEAAARLQSDLVTIFLFNSDSLMLEIAALIGNRSRETEHVTIRLGDGVSGKAALERRTIVVPNLADMELSAPLRAAASAEGIQAMYATPLIAKGNLVGVLNVSSRSPFNADQDWIDFFEALAGQAAMAVDSGKSFESLQRSNLELKLAYDTTIEGWSHALDLRDKETEGHTQRVTELTLKLARIAGITEAELVHVRRAALLHDIGKMGVPDAILLKPDKLTDEEWVVMRKHPTYAFELLSPIAYLHPTLDIPHHHHEKWDGSGYPSGLKGEQIPLVARLFAVVDVWDALRSDRPYRKGWSEEKVREHIRTQVGTHFDPKAVELFLRVVSEKTEEH